MTEWLNWTELERYDHNIAFSEDNYTLHYYFEIYSNTRHVHTIFPSWNTEQWDSVTFITFTTLLSALGSSSINWQSEMLNKCIDKLKCFYNQHLGSEHPNINTFRDQAHMSKSEGGILWTTGGDKKNGTLGRSANYLGNNCSSLPSGHFPELPRTQTLYRSHQWRI